MHSDAKAAWHPSTGAVLLEWRGPPPSAEDSGALSPVAGADFAAPAPGAEASLYASSAAGAAAFDGASPAAGGAGAAASGAGAAVSSAGASAAVAPIPAAAANTTGEGAAGPPPLMSLSGDALVASLQAYVARLLRCDASAIMPAAALVDNGLDSMSLVQLGGALREQYGLSIRDEHLFNTGLTLFWLRDNASALRAPYAFPRDSEAFAASAAAVPVPPHDANAVAGDSSAAAAQAAGAGAGAGAPASAVAGAGVGQAAAAPGTLASPVQAGPALVGLPPSRPRGRKQTWFQKNCPCFTWCWEI